MCLPSKVRIHSHELPTVLSVQSPVSRHSLLKTCRLSRLDTSWLYKLPPVLLLRPRLYTSTAIAVSSFREKNSPLLRRSPTWPLARLTSSSWDHSCVHDGHPLRDDGAAPRCWPQETRQPTPLSLQVNKQGQTRLAQYYEHVPVSERCLLEGEIVRKCLARADKQCSIVEHRNYKARPGASADSVSPR